ncbi:FtsH protease activity modulator HflK [Candidatus Enterovibrio altilux]|uniref:Protein HflK n=1 Tax=Candidatus Enterovibrio altilux TaxID=1927128 RepID=A0A291B900_9GAMM|nr:FtsH protease activity modulator HflK [Candidatus Enterovibrio luxaltus]ATF09462.1 HflK protein [Candidatus Enterovibrio luxaltus]
MAWNEPRNNGGQGKDPWGNRGGRAQGPPDLDEVFDKLSHKLNSLLGGKGPFFSNYNVIGLILLIGVIIWGVTGFYIIGEAERGVVLRLGEYNRIVSPGLNWKPNFIDKVTAVNVEAIRSLRSSGEMLTKDENVVSVDMDVQYRVANPSEYLYSVTNADDSLRQATDSALRAVIGDAVMDEILTTGRQQIRERTQVEINRIIDRYHMGLLVVDVNLQGARAPEQVQEAFDDAIKAREDEERFIKEAEAYQNDVLPKATGRAERLKKEALGYQQTTVNRAEGDVAQFEKLLPEYQAAPEITRKRLYLETMEKVFGNTSKVLIDFKEGSSNLLYLPLDKLMNQVPPKHSTTDTNASDYGIQIENSTIIPGTASPRQEPRKGRY